MTLALLLSFSLAAAPPAPRATTLANQGDVDSLFMEFGSVKPADYGDADRKTVAHALIKGAQASRKDPNVALTLAEKASQLEPSAAALTLLAQIEIDLELRSAAAGHFDDALKLDGNYASALIGRGDLAMKEEDYAVAVSAYERASKAGVKGASVQLTRARAAQSSKDKSVAELKVADAKIRNRMDAAVKNATHDWLQQMAADDAEAETKRQLAPDGTRSSEVDHFIFTYSADSKKTSDMFTFEGKTEKVMEHAYEFVSDKLGYQRTAKTTVVLMSREAYAAKHAGTPQARAGGYWDGREIVVNGGDDINERFVETMVHEFTHAVVSDLAGNGVPRWMNEGLAENMRLSAIGLDGKLEGGAHARLASLKQQDQLPGLNELDGQFAQMSLGVEAAYAEAALAVGILIEKHGYSEYVEALRDLRTRRAGPVLESHYMPIDQLDREVHDAL